MKKNKKLFAILTLVAFMMTLVPAFAFAAVTEDTLTATVAGQKVTLKLELKTAAADETTYDVYNGEQKVDGKTIVIEKDGTEGTAVVEVAKAATDKEYTFSVKTGDAAAIVAAKVTVKADADMVAAAKEQAAKVKAAADAFVEFVQDQTAAKLDTFRGLCAAANANADVATAVQGASKVEGYDFTKVTAIVIGYVADESHSAASIKTYLSAQKVTEADDEIIPTPDPDGKASVDASILATVDSNVSIEVNGGATTSNVNEWIDTKYAELDLVFRANNNAAAKAPAEVYIWAEESGKSKQATDAFILSGANEQLSLTNGGYVYKFTSGLSSSNTLKAAFVRGGTYTIKGSFVDPTNKGDATLKDVAVLKNISGKTTITANALSQKTREFKLKVGQGESKDNIDTLLKDGEKTEKFVEVAANTVATTKVTLTVFNNANKLMSTYPVKLSTNSSNIELDKTSITTDYKGEATFNIAGLREGEYKVYVNIGDYEATINVKVGATSASSIDLIKFPSNPIAADTLVTDYKDIFRFQLTDANGNIVTGNSYVGAEYAAMVGTDKDSSEQAKYAYIVSAPEGNKVKNADLKLSYVKDKDYYTLYVDNNKSFSAEGDYEVRVVLNNGKSATVNFTVKKFDKAVSLHIEYPTQAVELNSKTDAPDIYFLDANNVMKKANNRVTVAASGYAVAGIVESGSDAGTLTVKNDEKYIGQTITVTAASDKENLMATTTLTVADEAREVKLDTTRGQVNANNRVGFKVVDSTGHSVALGNDAKVEVTAVVANTGDADAKVSYSVSGSSVADLKSNGTGVINLSSNKETTATVQIMVKVSKPLTNANDNNTGLSTTYYTGTETFTFGAEADKSVVMTIGSKEMVANNVPVTTDVAPFIQDNRTYVPFRALTEAFGAEVEYNAENNTVTTKLNGKTVVLTVGSTVLTVNDNTVTMDVAPFIVDDRVVVPVRFVGEAFGFTVEATQDANTGATASVVFYQK